MSTQFWSRVSREAAMQKSVMVESVFSLTVTLVLLGAKWLALWPLWWFGAALIPVHLALLFWSYRSFDELTRSLYLKSWAAAGVVGLSSCLVLATWLGAVSQTSILLIWLVMWVSSFIVMLVQYKRHFSPSGEA